MTASLQKQFALTDGLLRGTALASNIFSNLAIALLSGFGLKGILISASIQLVVMGLLEIPTGIFADSFGWGKSLRYSLRLKFLVTLTFLCAVLASAAGYQTLAWSLIAAEALIDAFASSLMNGAYQAAYINWYSVALKKLGLDLKVAPNLFLNSFRYMLPLRLSIPVAIALIAVGIARYGNLSDENSLEHIAIGSIGLIIFLRFLVYVRVTKQLAGVEEERLLSRKIESTQPKRIQSLWNSLDRKDVVLILALSRFIYAATTFYVVGKCYQSLRAVETAQFGASNLWIIGALAGVSLFSFETLASRLLASAVNKTNLSKFTKAFGICFCAAGLSVLFTKTFFSDQATYPLLLWLLSLIGMILSNTVQRYVSSNIDEWVIASRRATWLSIGESVGLLSFGLVSTAAVSMSAEFELYSIVCLALLSAALLARNASKLQLGSGPEIIPFRSALSSVFLKAATIATALLVTVDLFSFAYSTIDSQKRYEDDATELIKASIYEPLNQGSFAEASSRLNNLRANKKIVCSRIEIWGFLSDTCQQTATDFRNRDVKTSLGMSSSTSGSAQDGGLVIRFDRSALWRAVFTRIVLTILFCVAVIFWLSHILRKLGSRLELDLERVLNTIRGGRSPDFVNTTQLDKFEIKEFVGLHNEFVKILDERSSLNKQVVAAQLASQVAHDVRSPLSALNIVISTLEDVPEDKRHLIRSAVQRINDIANNLLSGSKKNSRINGSSNEIKDEPLMLIALIDAIISEKRVEYRERNDVDLRGHLHDSYGLFSNIDSTALGSALSNLINNSVESIADSGTIDIELKDTSNAIEISIRDTGKGIPESVLKNLGQRGKSHGKNDENFGLGLHSAITVIKDAGGTLRIKSIEGRGTEIIISLPKAPAPWWFVPRIELKSDTVIVSLDDDESIHDTWNHRLQNTGVDHLRFITIEEFRSWFVENRNRACLFLIDFEFVAQNSDGLQVIADLNLSQNSILITSRSDESEVKRRAFVQGIRLIPKSVAHLVPLVPIR